MYGILVPLGHGWSECVMLALKDCLLNDILGCAHCLTAEKVCMLVWPVGIGAPALLFSNLYDCASEGRGSNDL